MKTTQMQYHIIEDNGGGLTLVVLGLDGRPIYMHGGYEYTHGALARDIAALAAGDDPRSWDGCEDEHVMAHTWSEVQDDPRNYREVADGVVGSAARMHTGIMGAAAQRECGGAL